MMTSSAMALSVVHIRSQAEGSEHSGFVSVVVLADAAEGPGDTTNAKVVEAKRTASRRS